MPIQELTDVASLKKQLQKFCGLPRFRQRLLHESTVLEDDTKLASQMDLQLVLLPYAGSPEVQRILGAAQNGRAAEVEEILKLPQDPNLGDGQRKTALHGASMTGHVEVVQVLLEGRADTNMTDQNGRTALHYASGSSYVKVLRMLVEAGADVSLADEFGNTALHLASAEGHLAAVRALLQAGSEVDFRNVLCDPLFGFVRTYFRNKSSRLSVVRTEEPV